MSPITTEKPRPAGSGELTYAFNIQRQIGTNMVAEIGYLGTLASDIQSSLLAYDQIPYRSLPANLSPFTAAGRTLLTSQITSAAAVAAGINVAFRRVHQGLRRRGDGGPSPAALPAVRADRYDQWRRRPARPLHLPLHGGEALAGGIPPASPCRRPMSFRRR